MIKIIKDKRGDDIAVLTNDTHISRWVEESGELCHDRTVRERIVKHIKHGDVVIDLGANIGDHTIAYAQAVGLSGAVYAFEPRYDAFACLMVNMSRFPQVTCAPFAIGDDMHLSFLNYTPNAGASHVGGGPKDGGHYDPIVITSLDNLDFPQVNFIKLDIEGSEFMALKGARSTIIRCRPIILCELNSGALNRYDADVGDIINFLEREDYRMELLDPNHNIDMEQTDALFFPK